MVEAMVDDLEAFVHEEEQQEQDQVLPPAMALARGQSYTVDANQEEQTCVSSVTGMYDLYPPTGNMYPVLTRMDSEGDDGKPGLHSVLFPAAEETDTHVTSTSTAFGSSVGKSELEQTEASILQAAAADGKLGLPAGTSPQILPEKGGKGGLDNSRKGLGQTKESILKANGADIEEGQKASINEPAGESAQSATGKSASVPGNIKEGTPFATNMNEQQLLLVVQQNFESYAGTAKLEGNTGIDTEQRIENPTKTLEDNITSIDSTQPLGLLPSRNITLTAPGRNITPTAPGAFNVGPFTPNEDEDQNPTITEPSPAAPHDNSNQSGLPARNNVGTVAVAGAVAVARPVAENEAPTQIARPDKEFKNKKTRSSTLVISILLGCLLVIGVTVGSICGAGICTGSNADMETQAPTSIRFFVLAEIQDKIVKTFGRDYFPTTNGEVELEPGHPRIQALNWLVFEDPLQLTPDADHLLQRFIMALTYLQTSQNTGWRICEQSMTTETCWMDVRGRGEESTNRWLTGVHECGWAGVYCEDETMNMTSLELENVGLNGPLPMELASLPELKRLRLAGNVLYGTIPISYSSFPSLTSLDLEHNKLSGKIPTDWFGTRLEGALFTNNSLTGTIPTEVGLFDTKYFRFGSNSLSGSIPTELFRPREGKSVSLAFDDNLLTGTLPTEIGRFHGSNAVISYSFGGNPLTGNIPSEISLLGGSLREFLLGGTALNGTLPEELFASCTEIYGFDVSSSDLTGTISTSLEQMTRLRYFDISNNRFHGTIPQQLSALTELRKFHVNGNNLSGSIPHSICALARPQIESFEVAADCLPTEGVHDPLVECSCCTLCCDGESRDYCLEQ
ncbi:leucine Rich Repeat [Seminavis robusta]|uniref:Leucine Rich Repeat n=1 Tax=Seminavis robusta TaxID=568900 RepID=A0A9N8DN45_9STRA|nr:leucine Rich Repeat [Seminavis robusta]|eukprot:Sro239_g095860.1 leucine Rich Repeat (850) ;mRNA; r:33912-36627